MREIGREFGNAKTRSQPREVLRPPPLAVMPMLGLTRRRRQANADCETYNFSLSTFNSSIFSGL
ncbi:MAG: hypothetical protein JWP25_7348 [Bradyrhizobium sp.]|jgi:hypothetical protein|nr:hypothetical protein [Bradyrhizobium sp.]MEA2868669.1 hypothetical protein [Bradyrhizobium sp.]